MIIAAEHSSANFGGEAFLPLNYFRLLRKRGVEAWLVTHSRTELELRELLPEEAGRIHFVRDTWVHRLLHRISLRIPRRLGEATVGMASHFLTQWMQRRIIAGMVRDLGIDVVHEPIPVSPKTPSLLFGLGAPVVIGPMNGGMEYPPAFQDMQSGFSRRFVRFARACSGIANFVLPGKVRARVLLVANERTRQALPRHIRGEVVELVENGVDLGIWKIERQQAVEQDRVKFVFIGRLVDWKAVDLLLAAFKMASDQAASNPILEIIGDGPMRSELEAFAKGLGVSGNVNFLGWMSQRQCAQTVASSDVLVLTSLFECGGAVVIEAMAAGLPVIATRWGGPVDYIDEKCGVLVSPTSREDLIRGFASAMTALALCPETRRRLGEAGRAKAAAEFDWERKIDRIVEVYRSVLTARPGQASITAAGYRSASRAAAH